jgi:RNAse (barnase) inhibitor barstar
VTKAVYEIDGRDFATLEEFYGVVSRVLIHGAEWGHNLDAFNDILRGGFGTPEGGFILRWKNSAVSSERLGYPEMMRQLDRRLARCHPSNRQRVSEDLQRARLGVGPTVFDWPVEIINDSEHKHGVKLVLD